MLDDDANCDAMSDECTDSSVTSKIYLPNKIYTLFASQLSPASKGGCSVTRSLRWTIRRARVSCSRISYIRITCTRDTGDKKLEQAASQEVRAPPDADDPPGVCSVGAGAAAGCAADHYHIMTAMRISPHPPKGHDQSHIITITIRPLQSPR
jgi:hypothetical protein